MFSSQRSSPTDNLYWLRTDGTGDVQRLTESSAFQVAGSWHQSGRLLAFEEFGGSRAEIENSDILILPIEGDDASGWRPGKPMAFLTSSFNETQPTFSPDGRWLAYVSDESGQPEVYVRPYTVAAGKWQVSTGGGMDPVWSRTARELFYRASDARLMMARYTVTGDMLSPDKPVSVAELPVTGRTGRWFDLHPDGQRFAVGYRPDDAQGATAAIRQNKIVLVFNFFDELRRLAPVR